MVFGPHFRRMARKPPSVASGEVVFFNSPRKLSGTDELSLTMALIADRYLLGRVYSSLQPDLFWRMPQESGVLLGVAIPGRYVTGIPSTQGDIDLLVVPYAADHVLLESIAAIEIKVARPTFAKQGRSPNDFGFSQAANLIKLGFPYVSVLHFVTSDSSPTEHWEMVGVARVLDAAGHVELLPSQLADLLPLRLMERTYGRLLANCPDERLGLAALYMSAVKREGRVFLGMEDHWMPAARAANINENWSNVTAENVVRLIEHRPSMFFDAPRYDPL